MSIINLEDLFWAKRDFVSRDNFGNFNIAAQKKMNIRERSCDKKYPSLPKNAVLSSALRHFIISGHCNGKTGAIISTPNGV